jgi:UDP-glucose 4-epimerase
MSLCLVTGGAGFIGSSLVRALIARGDRVRVIDNFSSGKRENLADIADRVELVEGDILDDGALARAVEGVELVFHKAAIPSVPKSMAEPIENHAANATGTLRVLEQSRRAGIRRLVYAASSAAYGDDPQLPKIETMPPAPISPYGGSKLAGEQYAQIYARAYGVETVCLRYFNVFGPRQDPNSQYAAVVPRFVTAIKEGRPITIFGDGTQSRGFTYVENVVAGNLAAATAGVEAAGGVLNIAAEGAETVNTLADTIGKLLGLPVERVHAPSRPGDVEQSSADISRARELIGFEPRIGFEEGLQLTIDSHADKEDRPS